MKHKYIKLNTMSDKIFKSVLLLLLAFFLWFIILYLLPSVTFLRYIVGIPPLIYMIRSWLGINFTSVNNRNTGIPTRLGGYSFILIIIVILSFSWTQWIDYLPEDSMLHHITGVIFNGANQFFEALKMGAIILGFILIFALIIMWTTYLSKFDIVDDTTNNNKGDSQKKEDIHPSNKLVINQWEGEESHDWPAVALWHESLSLKYDHLALRGLASDGISLISHDVPLSQLEQLGHYDIGAAADNNWVITDSSIASKQASLRLKDGKIYLKAISKQIETKIGKHIIAPGRARGIKKGETIYLGKVQLRVFN